jgi:beta-1,4-mannooligosaccharide phosphorylase
VTFDAYKRTAAPSTNRSTTNRSPLHYEPLCGSQIVKRARGVRLEHERELSLACPPHWRHREESGRPTRVIGRLRTPLLEPNESERDGYVPNVVYSCGAFENNGELVVPYGLSDGAIGFGVVSVEALLAAIR